MRLFAAVIPPEEALAELAAEAEGLRGLPGAGQLRWARRDGWHLTLAFYGEVEPGKLPELRARLERAARRRGPMALRLAGGGRFGDTVLWVGVSGGLQPLSRLAASAAAAGRRAGVDTGERRRYHPHLTLARQRRGGGVDLSPFAAALRGFSGTEWEATEVTLVRSHPPRSGEAGEQPRYEVLAAWRLGG